MDQNKPPSCIVIAKPPKRRSLEPKPGQAKPHRITYARKPVKKYDVYRKSDNEKEN